MFAALFTIAIALLLFRVFVLHLRSTDLDNAKFVNLPRELKLAILKERILETPSEKALVNLSVFLESEGVRVDIESYRVLFAEQLRIAREENAIALDNELYAKESAWMDRIEPFEFAQAKALREAGKKAESIQRYLQGVLRYYSDEKIESSLAEILPECPEAKKLLDGYRDLEKLRDESPADDSAIEKLSRAKDDWAKAVTALGAAKSEA